MASVMDKDFGLTDAAQRIAVLKSDLDRRREFAVAQAARIDELGPKPIADMPEELRAGPYEPDEQRKPRRFVLLYGKRPEDIAVAYSYFNALRELEWRMSGAFGDVDIGFTPTHYSEIGEGRCLTHA